MLPWSTGQADGQANRPDTVRQKAYGRANPGLPGRRFARGVSTESRHGSTPVPPAWSTGHRRSMPAAE